MSLKVEMAGEVLGTFLLVFIGCGSVCSAVITGAMIGAFPVAVIWGLGVTIAILLTGGLSGAHLNPAVTVALTVYRGFPGRKVFPYIAAQMSGAFLASAFLYVIYGGDIDSFEHAHGIIRGQLGSEASAMIFGEYFPSPGGNPLIESSSQVMPTWRAIFAEMIGTGLLLLVVLGITDERNTSIPRVLIAPAIGSTVTVLISIFSPLTMACFNPARDLAPRLFSSLAGWGTIPWTVNGMGWLTVYCIAPIVGGLIGGLVYRLVLVPGFALPHQESILEVKD